MSTVQQRTPSRLFQQSEYRVLNVDPDSNPDEMTNQEYCVFYTKRSRNRREDVTFIRQKSFLLKQAGQSLNLQLFHGFNNKNNSISADENTTNAQDTNNGGQKNSMLVNSSFPEMTCKQQQRNLNKINNNNNNKELPKTNLLEYLPKEIVLQILVHLTPIELSSFAKTSKRSRFLAYDDILWKQMCGKTWSSPAFMLSGEISDYQHTLRAWYNLNSPQTVDRLSVEEVMDTVFFANKWRTIYAAFQWYEQAPSIVHRFSARFNQRTVECFPIKRHIRYHCLLGHYRLAGIQNAAFVEYMVFMVQRPWHRNEFFNVYSSPIYNVRDFGLKTARSPRGQHNGEFFRRRGYYLKTMDNRKVHITYRYFPTIRFRLFKNHRDNRDFLLCQDIFLSSGESVDCYTAYEIIKESGPTEDAVGGEQNQDQIDGTSSTIEMNDTPYPLHDFMAVNGGRSSVDNSGNNNGNGVGAGGEPSNPPGPPPSVDQSIDDDDATDDY